jgi:DNA-binding LytR/AlgR family response regulator
MTLLVLPTKARSAAPLPALRTFRVLIAEACPSARNRIAAAVAEDAQLVLIGTAATGPEALNLLEVQTPDIVVMGMDLPRLSGREVIEAVGGAANFSLVFTTGARSSGVRALRSQAVDYFDHTADPLRIARSLARARARAEELALRSCQGRAADSTSLTVRTTEGRWLTLRAEDIMRIETANGLVRIDTAAGEVQVRKPLAELASRLGPEFVRQGRTAVVRAAR